MSAIPAKCGKVTAAGAGQPENPVSQGGDIQDCMDGLFTFNSCEISDPPNGILLTGVRSW